jgi:hypothetical protein
MLAADKVTAKSQLRDSESTTTTITVSFGKLQIFSLAISFPRFPISYHTGS